jgi:hypothetical protein
VRIASSAGIASITSNNWNALRESDGKRSALGLAENNRISSLETCAFERRDELHIPYVLPRETVVVRDEQIDTCGRRLSKRDRVGRLNGAVGANCYIMRGAGASKGRTVAICRIVVS